VTAARDAGPPVREPATPRDLAVVAAQLGRAPRGTRAVAHRCPCGLPDVVETTPRLPDGTPFPTLYYLTCPRAVAEGGRLESAGVMRDMAQRLRDDPGPAGGDVPEIEGVSAGGMPERVKCLHALLAHALAAGPGVNPLGDETLALVRPWWPAGPCVVPGAPPGPARAQELDGDG